jgi:phospholipid/cholesterol/gamma-HCH transport system substrate-binding protein
VRDARPDGLTRKFVAAPSFAYRLLIVIFKSNVKYNFMMKTLTILLFSLFSFKSCLKDGTNLYVVMEDANGLENGSKVKCKGLEVGEINELKISGNKVVATISLNSDFQATKGSVAQVDIDNIFGKKSLVLTPTDNVEIMADGDTIYAIPGNKLSIIEQLINKSDVDSLMNGLNLDSLKTRLDSVKIDGLLKKAEKLIDLNKLIK